MLISFSDSPYFKNNEESITEIGTSQFMSEFEVKSCVYNKYLSYINLSFNIICQNFFKESTAQYYPHLKKFSDNFVPVSCPLFTGTRCVARSKTQNYANK